MLILTFLEKLDILLQYCNCNLFYNIINLCWFDTCVKLSCDISLLDYFSTINCGILSIFWLSIFWCILIYLDVFWYILMYFDVFWCILIQLWTCVWVLSLNCLWLVYFYLHNVNIKLVSDVTRSLTDLYVQLSRMQLGLN